MSRPHRLTGAEFRVWRQNVPQLVDTEGRAVRALLLAEEQLLSKLCERARQSAQNVSHQAEVHEPDGSSRTVEIEIEVHEAPPGHTPPSPQHPNPVVLDVRVDGLKRMTARQVISTRLLEHYKPNDVMVRSPNGKFLRMVRNPTAPVPTRTDADRTAPRPEFCECSKWGNPHPGRHHPVCPHNRLAPPEEQALSDLDIGPSSPLTEGMSAAAALAGGRISEQAVQEAPQKPTAEGIVSDLVVHAPGIPQGEAPKAPEPNVCQCKDWNRPEGADPLAHHPICEFRLQYEREHAQSQAQGAERPWLLTLQGERVREATLQEIAEADRAEERTGLRTVQVNEIPYVVGSPSSKEVTEQDVPGAMAELEADEDPTTEPPPPMEASAESADTDPVGGA